MILCCGEALVDFVPLEDGTGYRPCPGGSIYNIAVGLARLQTPVAMFTKISNDFFGQFLVDYLIKNGVDIRSLLRGDGPTTLAFVSLPGKGAYEPQYAFYANQATDRSLDSSDIPDSLPGDIEALHFGSISLILEPGATSLENLMRRESRNRIISLDPNIRPSLIQDHQLYRTRFETWLKLVDILRLSLADLRWLYPEAKAEEIIDDWMQIGLCLCILTLGEQGALGFTSRGEVASVSAPSVQVVDTVGAGDAFLAAGLSYLHKQKLLQSRDSLSSMSKNQLVESLSFAARAAAINCSRAGADPPYLREMG